MSAGQGIDRRTLLWWLVALGLAGDSVGRRRSAIAAKPPDRVPVFLAARESAVVLGRAYLDLRPAERDPAILLEKLDVSRRARSAATGRQEVPPELKRRHREDFRRGRIVELQGWFLSETELRLSALVYLSAAGADAPP